MVDTLFADVSEFQVEVSDKYPYHFFSFRSNDGTYRDQHFTYNLAWAKQACDTGRLAGFLVYFVWEPNWAQTIATFKQMVGKPHPKMAVMIDAETWGGKISGNQSAGLNAARENLISWAGGYMSPAARLLRKPRKRVIGYANAGDFASMWPTRGDTKVVLANYSNNPVWPGKIAHQFSDHYACPPFGYCDMNSADGLSPAQFAAVLGLDATVVPTPAPTPPLPAPRPGRPDMIVCRIDPATVPAGTAWPGWVTFDGANVRHIHNTEMTDNNARSIMTALGQASAAAIGYQQYLEWKAGS